jgi:MFS family permease
MRVLGALRRIFAGVSRNTALIAAASLFADLATEMISPILPIFLTQTLHASGSIVGLIDGVAQAVRNILNGFAGALSDRFRARKPLALTGYLLAAVAKPLMGISTIWEAVFGARLLDRLAAGLRAAPRDALVASSVAGDRRGEGFGVGSFGDNAGAFLGPLLSVLLLYALHLGIRAIFYLAVIPGLLAGLMVLPVREQPFTAPKGPSVQIGLRSLPKEYWRYLLVTALFGLGNSSDAFLILRIQESGASLEASILIYGASNMAAALVSYPAGRLSDTWGRKAILLASFFAFAIAYLAFALTPRLLPGLAAFLVYGLHQGAFRAVGRAFATDFAPEHLRASSIGWHGSTLGMSQLLASIIAGLLWDGAGHASPFIYGVAFSTLAIAGLMLLVREEGRAGRFAADNRQRRRGQAPR